MKRITAPAEDYPLPADSAIAPAVPGQDNRENALILCMRSLLGLPFAAAILASSVLAQHPAPSAGTATQYPSVEAHPQDHLTIAADPYDTPAKASIFRVNYLSAN